MRVFVAGASGAIGSRLVPQLIDAGHEVIGTHHSPASAEPLRALGAKPVRLDLLDARAVRTAVLETEPEAIVHQATALADVKFGRNMDNVLAETNELRTKGTDALLAAACEAGVGRFVAQSVAAFSRYARQGGLIKTEDDPLDPTPPTTFRQSAAAMTYLEQAVTQASAESPCATASSTEPPTTAPSNLFASGSFRSSATAAASGPGSTSTTPPPQPFSHWSRTARRSTTSSTTSQRPYATGCRSSHRRSARSRRGASPPGSRGCSQARPWS